MNKLKRPFIKAQSLIFHQTDTKGEIRAHTHADRQTREYFEHYYCYSGCTFGETKLVSIATDV